MLEVVRLPFHESDLDDQLGLLTPDERDGAHPFLSYLFLDEFLRD